MQRSKARDLKKFCDFAARRRSTVRRRREAVTGVNLSTFQIAMPLEFGFVSTSAPDNQVDTGKERAIAIRE
jgi:hypothetical protein